MPRAAAFRSAAHDGAVRPSSISSFGPERLQLGEDGVVADRNDVEGEFVDALGIEGEPRQRLRRGEQRGREEPPPVVVKQLEGGEIVGEQQSSPGPADERDELSAEAVPVRLGHGQQALRAPAGPSFRRRSGCRRRRRDPRQRRATLRATQHVGRVQQPPAGRHRARVQSAKPAARTGRARPPSPGPRSRGRASARGRGRPCRALARQA